MMSLHPVDQLARIEATAAELRAMIAADREARVGSTHHAIVTRIDDRDHVVIEPLPDLAHVLALLTGPLVVVDTETTGLHVHNGDRLISLAILPVSASGAACAPFRFTVNPGRPSSPQALAVHGMSDAELAMLPPLSAAMARQAVRFIGASTLVAHNAPFDVGFLNMEYARLGAAAPPPIDLADVVDTLQLARRKHTGAANNLDALCSRYGIDTTRRTKHGALLDAQILAEVYVELLGGKQTSLGLAMAEAQDPLAPVAGGVENRASGPRPARHRLTDAERTRHAAFIGTLGASPVWRDYLGEEGAAS